MLVQLAKYYIPSEQTVLWIDARIVVSSSFKQSDKRGGLLHRYTVGGGIEISVASRLDAESVASEVYRIEIHSQDFIFAVQHLYLYGGNPLLSFHYK